jgi:hypothetical protein
LRIIQHTEWDNRFYSPVMTKPTIFPRQATAAVVAFRHNLSVFTSSIPTTLVAPAAGMITPGDFIINLLLPTRMKLTRSVAAVA